MLNNEHLTFNILDSFMENIRLEKNSKAKKDFEEILSKDWTWGKRSIRKLYEVGEIFEIKEARYYINEINKVLCKKPKNLSLRLIRQEIIYNSGEYDIKDLIEINKKDLEIFPESPYLINFKGLIFWNLNKYDEAIRHIDQALDLDKNNVDFLNNKAKIYSDDGQFLESAKVIQYALGLEPNYFQLEKTREYIDRKEYEAENKEDMDAIQEIMYDQEKSIKNIKFEFIQIFALFVVILTVVVKVVSFDYKNFESVGFFDIILYQLAINFSWLLALVLTLILIIVLHIKKK